MKAAEVFLKNREWRFASTSNLKEAITFIIKNRPQYLLIAADHPNKKVKMIPKLIAQAFPVTVIGYTESASNQNVMALQMLGLEYNLYPPVSGPSIVRLIAKIEKDLERKKQEGELHKESFSSHGPQKNGDHSGAQIIQGGAAPQNTDARAALQRMLQSDVGEENSEGGALHYPEKEKGGIAYMPSSSEEKDSKPGVIVAKGEAKLKGGIAYNPEDSQSQGVAGSYYQPEKKKEDEPSWVPVDQDPYSSDWEAPDTEQAGKKPKGTKKKAEETVVGNKDEDVIIVRATEVLNSIYDSIVLKGTVESLDRAVNHKQSRTGPAVVDQQDRVACLVVNSPRFSGYLIAAMGKNKVMDDELMAKIRSYLLEYMKKNVETMSEKDLGALKLKIQQIPFQAWAKSQADFLIRSIHNDNEVAMAFFPTTNTKANIEESFSENMIKMTINDIAEDSELEFDMYIYLPENQKYILYNKQGHIIGGAQVSRLKEKGVTHVHMKKEDQGQVQKYKAQNFLNERIAAYKASDQAS